MKPKVVTFLLSSLRGGGAERVVLNVARELIIRGYRVDILVVKKEGVYLSQVPQEARLIELKTYSRKYLRTLLMLPALFRYVKDERPQAFISSLTRNNISLLLLTPFLKNVATRFIVVEHNMLSKSLGTGIKDRLIPYLVRWLYQRADHVVGVSAGVVKNLVQQFKVPQSKAKVIYNPMNLAEIVSLSKEAISPDLFAGTNKNILAVGRLTKQKNFSLLIDSFALLVVSFPQARLTILGEGELRSDLTEQIRKLGLEGKVTLPGFVANPFAYMVRADVVVLSSLWEGFGNVLVEAMACGTAVVSTDCESGPAEIFAEGTFGVLVPNNDPEALATAIGKQLLTPIKGITVSNRARDFDVSKITDEYVTLIS
jgi:glycosyltransferase involved in cell wall biosynthesis